MLGSAKLVKEKPEALMFAENATEPSSTMLISWPKITIPLPSTKVPAPENCVKLISVTPTSTGVVTKATHPVLALTVPAVTKTYIEGISEGSSQ